MLPNIREVIETDFDPKLRSLYESKALDNLLFRITAPGTRIGTPFGAQFDIYLVLDGPFERKDADFRHVGYLGYHRVDTPHELTTTEIPAFFIKIAEELTAYDWGFHPRKF